MTTSDGAARIHWIEHGEERSARWRSESGWPAQKKVVLADDNYNATNNTHSITLYGGLWWGYQYTATDNLPEPTGVGGLRDR